MGGGKGLIFRRITSLKTNFLLLFFLCAIPIISHAQTFTQNNLTYTVGANNTVSVKAGNTFLLVGNVAIPETVTRGGITYIVTSIEERGFRNCRFLISINIPSSVTSIGNRAFYGCASLKSITLEGATPPSLGTDVFKNSISSETTFKVPNENYLTANEWQNVLNGENVVVKTFNLDSIGLYTNCWNFVVGFGNVAGLYNNNSPTSFVSNFTPNNTINDPTDAQNPHCDIAVVGYDYSTNNWNSSYMYANNPTNMGRGYFVWAFNENAQGTTITSDKTITTVSIAGRHLSPRRYEYVVINNGPVSGSGSLRAKWFALGNMFNVNLTRTMIFSSYNSSYAQSDVLYTYDAYNGRWNSNSSVVLPGQGFMIAAKDGTDYFLGRIDPSANTSNLPAQPENYGIRFSVNSNGINSDMFAKQVSEANDGFDTKDAYALFGNNENLVEPYFVVEGRQIIHNRYNSDNYACEINFHAQKSGTAQLSVSDVPEGTTVSIVDLAMNEETVLDGEPYQIDIEAGENSGRYQIKIVKNNSSINTTAQNEANISIWNNNKEIFVKGENLQRVEVYNTIGQKVYQREISGENYNFTFDNKGAYIVKVTSANGTKSQKVVIK